MIRVGAVLDGSHVGGVTSFCLNLARGFQRAPGFGVEVVCLAPDGVSPVLAALGDLYGVGIDPIAGAWKAREGSGRHLPRIGQAIRAARHLRSSLDSFDVVLCNDYYSTTVVWLATLGTSRSVPRIRVLHGVDPPGGGLRLDAYRVLRDVLGRKLTAKVAVDRFAFHAAEKEEKGPKPRLIPNSVDPELWRSVGLAREAASRPRLGFVGRFEAEKGIERLTQLVAELARLDLDFEVCLQGAGSKLEETTERIRRWADVSVEAPGAPRWDRIDVLIMPSLSEGAPMAPQEALASGARVVCSGAGGLADLSELGADVVEPWSLGDAASTIARMEPGQTDPAGEIWEDRYAAMLASYAALFREVTGASRGSRPPESA